MWYILHKQKVGRKDSFQIIIMIASKSLFLICLIILGCISNIAVCKKKSSAEQNKEKIELRKRTISTLLSTNPIIYLGDTNFSKYVVERPREYHAVLLFTATASQYQCSVCLKTKNTFIEAASHYVNQYDFETTPIENRVVFFVLEVDAARSVFSDMQLETVPRLYALPPTEAKSPKMKISNFEIEAKALLDGTASLLNEVSEVAKIKVIISLSGNLILIY